MVLTDYKLALKTRIKSLYCYALALVDQQKEMSSLLSAKRTANQVQKQQSTHAIIRGKYM